MRRMRALLAGLTAVAVILGPVSAQTTDKVLRLGLLQTRANVHSVTLAELGRRGFVEGRNLVVEARTGTAEQLPELARELVDLKPDVILAGGAAIAAAKIVTSTIPIVMSFAGQDPVASGFAASVARPGGNITGFVIWSPELDGKRLELLHEAVPTARRIAVLMATPLHHKDNLAAMRPVADAMGIDLLSFYAEFPAEYDAAFGAMHSAGAQALMITADARFSSDGARLAALALETQLPTACQWRSMVEQGCLLGYSPVPSELRRRAADYVERIFHGTTPGELPIEGPTRLEFTVNMKTAAALQVTLPQIVLLRADEVIE
jgi:putative ABC transport system substrate-binding protein